MPFIRGQWFDFDEPAQSPISPNFGLRGGQLGFGTQTRIDAMAPGGVNNPYQLGQNLSGPVVKPQNGWQPYTGVVDGPVIPNVGMVGTPFSGPAVKPDNGWTPVTETITETPYTPPTIQTGPVDPDITPKPTLDIPPPVTTKPALDPVANKDPVTGPIAPKPVANPQARRRSSARGQMTQPNTNNLYRFK